MKTYVFIKKHGFIDCVSELKVNPETEYTWRWKLKSGILPARIDYVFIDANFIPKNTKVFKKTSSDHYLLKVELKYKENVINNKSE